MTVKNRSKICIIISLAIFVLALVLTFAGRGVNLGIDFSGGLSMQYKLTAEHADTLKEDVDATLKAMDVGTYTVTFQGAEGNEINVRIKDVKLDSTEADAAAEGAGENAGVNTGVDRIQTKFEEGLTEKGIQAELMGDISYVGPVAGANLVKNAIVSVLIAAALMLIYIAIRFDLSSGLAAVFGLLHDVLMMLSFMVLLRSFIQMNSSFIAAMLTIVGYSINNTIVIFDRIRENHRKAPAEACEAITSKSVKECLGRTINTTATTLITIVALCVLGVASIREFALPIIIGILSGVYSANMINGYVWAFLEEKRQSRKTKKA